MQNKIQDQRSSASINSRQWKCQLALEVKTNAPYWEKVFSTMNSEKRADLQASIATSYVELSTIMKENNGMFQAAQIQEFEEGKKANSLLVRAIAACELLRIPLQTLFVEIIPQPYSASVDTFRRMDMDLPKFYSVGAMADYFLKSKPGTQAVLAGGRPKIRENVVSQAKARQVSITVEGIYTNFVATFKKIHDSTPNQRRAYIASRRRGIEHCFSNKMDLLVCGGPPVYIEGNHTTLTRQMRKVYGAGSYSIRLSENRKGWMVSLKPSNHSLGAE